MWYNDEIILIGNPRCASQSIVEALKLEKVGNILPHATPEECFSMGTRSRFWKERKKLLVVRDPALRHLSASDAEEEGLIDLKHPLTYKGKSHIRIFAPQVAWMTRRVDYLVGLPWLAEFFNHMGWPTLHRKGMLFFGHQRPHPTTEKLLTIHQYYAYDYEVLNRTPIWHPEGKTRFLLRGDCVECDKKKERKNAT